MSDIREWLEGLHLGQYAQVFEKNEIDLDLARDLTDDTLEKIGVTLAGHRMRIMRAVTELGKVAVEAPGLQQDDALTVSAPDAERRQLTVMFCDLVGSTALSEKLDPEDLREVMRAYQDACSGAIDRFDGHIAQTLGDGLMVYFGYPVAHEDDAQRAVRAGLDIVGAIADLSARFEAEQSVMIDVRVGIHTGLVVAGEVGGVDTRGDMAVVGETPNIAARIEGLAKPGTVVVGDRTRRLVGDVFEFDDLGAHDLSGLSVPMTLYRARSERTADSRFEAMHPKGLTPFVGRDEEIGLLLGRWASAKSGEGQVVLLEGEPGIGKSRITNTLRELIAGDAHTRLQYQCSPFYTSSAFHPISTHVERAASFAAEDSDETKLDKLEALIGEEDRTALALIASLLALPVARYPVLGLSPQKQKERTIDTLVERVLRLAKADPILLAFEDVHWIDPTSLEALDQLIMAIGTAPIFAVITFRPEFKPQWGVHSHITSISLNRLGKRQSALLIERVTGDRPLPTALVEQIIAKTDGVPLFIEELTKAVIESDIVSLVGGRYELTGSVDSLAIPDTLHDSLMARLDKLIPVKEVAQVGAAIGREFPHQLVALLSPMSEADLNAALDKLVASELVFRRGAPPEATYTFKHALVQDAAYDSMLKRDRQKLHHQIAVELRANFPSLADTEPELLAHHLTQAEEYDQAIVYWHQAGQLAFLASAFSEAQTHLQHGLNLLPHIDDEVLRYKTELGLQTFLGLCFLSTQGYGAEQSIAAFSRAEELLDHAENISDMMPILWSIGTFNWARGDFAAGEPYLRRMYDIPLEANDPEMLLLGEIAYGCVCLHVGRPGESVKHLESAISKYVPEKHRDTSIRIIGQDFVIGAYAWLVGAKGITGYLDQGLEAAKMAIALAKESDHPFSAAVGLGIGASMASISGHPEHALNWADEGIRLAENQSLLFFIAWGRVARGNALRLLGKDDEAIEDLIWAHEFVESIGADQANGWVNCYLTDLFSRRGDFAAAELAHERMMSAVGDRGELMLRPMALRLGAQLLIRRDGPNSAEAEDRLRKSIGFARAYENRLEELRSAVSLARLRQSQNKTEEARDLLAPVYGWFTEGFDTADLKEASALLNELN